MLGQERLSREEVLRELNVAEDTLSMYEQELEINPEPSSGSLETFTKEDLKSVQLIHKLHESGLTCNEIKLLASFSDVLKNLDLEQPEGIKSLLQLSPVYRLKQSLNIAKQELSLLKGKVEELEFALKRAVESGSPATESVSLLQSELEAKQKIINNLDKKLSEVILQKAQLESQLAMYKEGKGAQIQIKGKKAKELYQVIVQKDLEIAEIKKKSEQLQVELDQSKEGSLELQERLEHLENSIAEMEIEVEERYQEQISGLHDQIEDLIEKKQSEWETYYVKTSEQHRKELLTLQRKHEQEILRLKQKIKEQIEELEELRTYKNPLFGLFKIGAGQR